MNLRRPRRVERAVLRRFMSASICAVTLGIAPVSFAQNGAPSAAARTRAQQDFAQGLQAYQDGRLHDAGEHLLAAYRVIPSPELAFNIGRVYERMGEAELATRYFRIYIDAGTLAPDERADLDRRIAALASLDRRQHEQIFELPPSNSEVVAEATRFFNRGVQMFRRRRWQAAYQAFEAAYQFARLPEIIYNLAIVAERLGNEQLARDWHAEYDTLIREQQRNARQAADAGVRDGGPRDARVDARRPETGRP